MRAGGSRTDPDPPSPDRLIRIDPDETRSCGPDLPTPCTPPRWSVGTTAVPWAFRAATGPRAEPGEGVVCGIVRRQWISHRLSGKSTERSEMAAYQAPAKPGRFTPTTNQSNL